MNIRSYSPSDYGDVVTLYKDSNLYGGQFDEDRDSHDRLRKRIEADSDAILVAETDGKIIGTVSLIEDGRVAWLFRFCVLPSESQDEVAKKLLEKASEVLRRRGHHQLLVYSPTGNKNLNEKYEKLGFFKGNDYTSYWKEV